jgi:hypothetical protein
MHRDVHRTKQYFGRGKHVKIFLWSCSGIDFLEEGESSQLYESHHDKRPGYFCETNHSVWHSGSSALILGTNFCEPEPSPFLGQVVFNTHFFKMILYDPTSIINSFEIHFFYYY